MHRTLHGRLRLFFLLFCALSSILASAQEQRSLLTGYVTDGETGESLIGVTVQIVGTTTGTTTNNYGYYTLSLPSSGEQVVRFSYIGYAPVEIRISSMGDSSRNIRLTPDDQLLQGVTVMGSHTTELETLETGRVKIRGEDIHKVPSLFGEQDLVKYIQLLPGVAQGTEGFSGPIVRGGNVDENLYLLDGNPLYNAHHLLGLFSTFNTDAVKTANFYKGSFPARFGGRLSSVLDVRTKDGDMQEYHGTFSVGLISSRLHVEGPIWRDRTSLSISLRRTYIDLVAKPFVDLQNKKEREANPQGNYDEVKPSYYFYDINAKVNHKFSDRDRLYLSFYLGEDRFSVRNKSTYTYKSGPLGTTRLHEDIHLRSNWGNGLISLGWNHLYGPTLFSNTTLYYGQYKSRVLTDMRSEEMRDGKVTTDPQVNFALNSGIKDLGLRSDFEYRPANKHYIRFGLDGIAHRFSPSAEKIEVTNISEETLPQTDRLAKSNKDETIRSHEVALYAEDEMTLTPSLSANIGARASLLRVESRTYLSLEPRLSLHYKIIPSVSAKASYAEMSQSVHLLQSTAISLPTDLWVPVTARIKPMRSHQAVLGLYWEQGGYEASLEGYYKYMHHQIAYRDGAPMYLSDSNWQERVAMGNGQSYGMELLLRKNAGKITGWLSYTLSWSNRLFPGGEVNNGKPFPDKYDNRHKINIVGQYSFGKHADLSAAWIMSSGNRMTIPTGIKKNMQGEEVEYVTSRNNFQMPLYHRLDLSANFYRTTKKGHRHIWNISVYNAYMHHNPLLINTSLEYHEMMQQAPDNGQTSTVRQKITSIALFPIIPSVSYTYKF